jgi:hypothetical protein
MATKITHDIAGFNNFLSQADYRNHIPDFLEKFEDKFQLAEKVEIVFEDEINPDSKKLPVRVVEVSDDGKEIKAYYKTYRYSDGKNGLSKPDEVSFFKGLRHYLINTVIKEDNERY